jgi:GTP-binding protein EngB required for normal cell division
MITVFAIDALEIKKVEEYDSSNLKQDYYGKTNISEFSEPRTMVLWSSFMTGQNKEKEILAKGDKEMWNTKWPIEKTFFSRFDNPKVIDLPGYNYNTKQHHKQRELLKKFFEVETDNQKNEVRSKYNKLAFDHHKNIKEDFLASLNKNYDFLLGYFGLADLVGHLSFGNNTMMKMIYQDLNEIGEIAAKKSDKLVVLSDHGMKAQGMFGDHSTYGFWSTNFKDLGNPKITEFRSIIEDLR